MCYSRNLSNHHWHTWQSPGHCDQQVKQDHHRCWPGHALTPGGYLQTSDVAVMHHFPSYDGQARLRLTWSACHVQARLRLTWPASDVQAQLRLTWSASHVQARLKLTWSAFHVQAQLRLTWSASVVQARLRLTWSASVVQARLRLTWSASVVQAWLRLTWPAACDYQSVLWWWWVRSQVVEKWESAQDCGQSLGLDLCGLGQSWPPQMVPGSETFCPVSTNISLQT